MPRYKALVAQTLAEPDRVRRSQRASGTQLFSRWYPEINGGKNVVVVVMSEEAAGRRWVMTAYLARRLAGGDVEWTRS